VVEPGRTCLGDRYELGGLIASGGMGQVWRGTDVLLGRPVAVKVLRSEYTGDPTFLARFRAEAQNAAALSHPHIAAVYDYGETAAEDDSGETLAYLVMELVQGRPLNEVIRSEGRLDIPTTLTVLEQTAAGLAEAHRAGMVHRDVKPGNLLVTPDGAVKITDFGIAWSARSVALTRTGQVLGTPQYLSPEQAEGRHATPASDVYALGLIGYECLTGHAAFDGENAVTIALKQVREEPEPLPEALPARVRELIRRSLAKDPDRRFPDGAAFVNAVAAVRDGRPLDSGPSTAVGARSVPFAAAAAGAGLAARGSSRPAARRHRAPTEPDVVRPPARRGRRSRIAVVLLPLIGLLAGAGIAAMVLQGLAGDGNPPAEAAAQQQEDDAGIVLHQRDYVGRPADEVAMQLAALGLTVHRETRESADADPGTVLKVDPAGERLEPGAAVVIVVATAPDSPSSSSSGTSGGSRATNEVTRSTAAESSAPAEGAAVESDDPSDPASDSSEDPASGSSAESSTAEPTPSDTPTDSGTPSEPSTTTEPSAPASPTTASTASTETADTAATDTTGSSASAT
jgi:eukaryotic-like serine/threonine-protein kinase